MIFNTLFKLSTKPEDVAKAYKAGIEIWDDIIEKEYKKIHDEEIDKYCAMDTYESLNFELDIMIGTRLEKIITSKIEQFQKKVGLELFEDVFPSVGFFRLNEKEADYLIRAFRRSDIKLSLQNKAEKFWEFVRYPKRYGYRDQGMITIVGQTVTTLCKDPHKVAEAYEAGTKIWQEIYSNYSKIKDEETQKMMSSYAKSYETQISERLAETLPAKEAELEKHCGDLYKEAIAVISVIFFYDAQDGLKFENGAAARRIVKAFQLSNCSETLKEKVEEVFNVVRFRNKKVVY